MGLFLLFYLVLIGVIGLLVGIMGYFVVVVSVVIWSIRCNGQLGYLIISYYYYYYYYSYYCYSYCYFYCFYYFYYVVYLGEVALLF
jgi:hypothetical protein